MFFEFCALYTGRFCSPVVIPNLSSMNSIQFLLYDPLEFLGIMAMSFDLCFCTLFCLLCIYHITSAIKCALEINKNNN